MIHNCITPFTFPICRQRLYAYQRINNDLDALLRTPNKHLLKINPETYSAICLCSESLGNVIENLAF